MSNNLNDKHFPQFAIEPNPIFIVGAPRSGTSLLRNMLNRHPSIAICDETYFFYYVYSRRKAFGDLGDINARRRLADQYLSTNRIKKLQIDIESLAHALIKEGKSYEMFFLTLIWFYATNHGKLRYGEKTPQHAMYAETICEMFPQCRLIHMVRDPRDVVESLMRMPWANESLTGNARNWVRYTVGGSQVQHKDNYLLIRYEQLIENPSSTLMDICKFIDEPYDEIMLTAKNDFHEHNNSNEWWFQRANEPLNQDRIGVWRKELSSTQIALVEWVAGLQMHKYGYEPIGVEPTLGEKLESILDEIRVSIKHKMSNWGRLWYYWVQPTRLAQEEAWINREYNTKSRFS